MNKKKNKTQETVSGLKPVGNYPGPGYPGKETFNRNPGLLLDFAPSSWLKKKISAAALLVFTLSAHPVLTAETTPVEERRAGQKEKKQDRENLREQKPQIAPLFIHGHGAGATGCVVVSPPAFLSEADALEVIAAALEKEGITFDKRNYILENIYSVDDFSKQYFEGNSRDEAGYADKIPFYFDFYSTRYNIGVKYISKDNHDNFAEVRSLAQDEKQLRDIKKDPHLVTGRSITVSTVQSFDMIVASQRIRECLRQYGAVNAVFFYDPMVDSGGSDVVAGQLLAHQVKDFGRWLKKTFKGPGEKENRR